MFVDLHLHTNRSDGVDPPSRVAARANALGIAAIAITDHDTVCGVEEAEQAAQGLGLGFLRGVEISAEYRGVDVHVVGLGIDLDCVPLLAKLDWLRQERETRLLRMVERLHALGIPVAHDGITRHASSADSVGRLHVAREVHALGYARTVQEAFDRYIGRGKPAFVGRGRIACDEAIALIHQANGLAMAGHPGIGKTHKLLRRLLELPFDGVEAYHTHHTAYQTEHYLQLAEERGLLVSGGSDCHGGAKEEPEMGKVQVPYACFERICGALKSRR